MLKKIIVILLSFLLIVILALGGISWYLYKNQEVIANYVLKELNEMQKGYTKLEKVQVDLLTNFPYISIDLKNIAFYPSKQDTLKPIYKIQDVYVGFSYADVAAGKYKVKKIAIKKGELHIERYEDGSINLLLAKAMKEQKSDTVQSDKKLSFKIKQITLQDFKITKKDFGQKTFVDIHFQELESFFKLTEEQVTNHLETKFELIKLDIDDSTWFKNKHLHWETDIDYHFANQFLTIRPSQFELEQAEFSIKGTVDIAKNAFLDLEIFGKKPDFKLITAFAPPDVYEKLKNYKTSGEIYFRGKIVGEALNNTPKIDLEFGCKNAQFINPDAKSNSIKDLNITGFFTNGAKRNLETSELYVKQMSANPSDGTFRGSFHIKNFVNPFISVDVHSNLDLATLQNFFDIPALKGLQGRLIIDMTVDELLDYNDVPTTLGKLKDGTDSRLILKDIRYKTPFYTNPISLNGEVDIVEGKLVLKEFVAKIGKSDFSLKGDITSLAAFLHGQDAPMEVNLVGSSTLIDLKDLLSFNPLLTQKQDEQISDLKYDLAFKTNTKYLRGAKGLPQGEFFVKDLYFKLKNYPHAIHDWHIDMLIDEKDITMKLFEGELDATDFHLLGYIKNYNALFVTERFPEMIDVSVNLKSNHIRFKDLFTYKGTNFLPKEYQDETIDNFVFDASLKIPAGDLLTRKFYDNMTLNLRKFDGIFKIHHYGLREIGGDVVAKAGALKITNFHGRVGKSDFVINADIESVTKLMASDFKGKKFIQLKSKLIDLDELITLQGNTEQDKPKTTEEHAKAFNIFEMPFPNLDLDADIGRFKYKKYDLAQFKTKLRIQPDHYVYVDNLEMFTAGGKLKVNGYFNGSDPKKIYFKSTTQVEGLDMDRIFYKMDNFGQDYLVSENVHGKVTGTIQSKVLMHPDLVINLRDTEAHIEVVIKDGRLTNFPPFKMMDKFMGDKDLENVRFGELKNTLDVKNGNITIPKMEISSNLGYMMISGTQNFDKDMAMKYTIEIPSFIIREALWNYLFKRRKKPKKNDIEEVPEGAIISSEDRKSKRLAVVDIFGTPEKFDFDFQGFKKNKN